MAGAECVDDWSQGIPLTYTRELADYWADEYDWRAREAALNRFDHFTTEIDGLDIHFIHQRSPRRRRVSVADHARLARIDRRVPQGDRAADRRRVSRGVPVAAGIRLLRQADEHRLGRREDRRGVGDADGPPGLRALRRAGRRLGRRGHHADRPQRRPLRRDPPEHAARHRPPAAWTIPTDEEKQALAHLAYHRKWDTGYSKQQSTRPQTIGYGLVDSPVGQLAWIVEKFWSWTDCDGHPENVLTRDELLDNVMLYWATASAASSARLYWESFRIFGGGERNASSCPPASRRSRRRSFARRAAGARTATTSPTGRRCRAAGTSRRSNSPSCSSTTSSAFFATVR